MRSTILLLASDPVIRRAIASALEWGGHVVLGVGDIASAVIRLKESTPELLIIRHYTESMSGHDAAMYLRQMAPGIPVLLLGGLLDDGSLEIRETIRGFDIFPKPFQPAELLDKVKEVLAKRATK